MIIMCAPTVRARSSASFRLARASRSRSENTSPSSSRGGTLISTLNWPSSVWKAGIGDRLERGGVDQRRVAGVVGQVELDLEAERAPLRMEARLGEHPGEHVQTRPDLQSVALAVLAAEGPGGDLLAHEGDYPCRAPALQLPGGDLGALDH